MDAGTGGGWKLGQTEILVLVDSNISLPVGRLFPVACRMAGLERLWTTGSLGLEIPPVDDSVIRSELQGVIDDLTRILREFDSLKAQEAKESWLE